MLNFSNMYTYCSDGTWLFRVAENACLSCQKKLLTTVIKVRISVNHALGGYFYILVEDSQGENRNEMLIIAIIGKHFKVKSVCVSHEFKHKTNC